MNGKGTNTISLKGKNLLMSPDYVSFTEPWKEKSKESDFTADAQSSWMLWYLARVLYVTA